MAPLATTTRDPPGDGVLLFPQHWALRDGPTEPQVLSWQGTLTLASGHQQVRGHHPDQRGEEGTRELVGVEPG